MSVGRRSAVVAAADPPVTYAGSKRTPEGIENLRRCSRARSRALRRIRTTFAAEFEERWPKVDRPKDDAPAYSREQARALRALAAAHPAEFRAVLLEELKREGLG
jgi:hypothetical protein